MSGREGGQEGERKRVDGSKIREISERISKREIHRDECL